MPFSSAKEKGEKREERERERERERGGREGREGRSRDQGEVEAGGDISLSVK